MPSHCQPANLALLLFLKGGDMKVQILGQGILLLLWQNLNHVTGTAVDPESTQQAQEALGLLS